MSADLNNAAMLVSLSISEWTNRAVDRAIPVEVGKAHNAATSGDTYVKSLLPPDTLRTISRIASSLRTAHNALTLPWEDGGKRVLLSSKFFAYQETMSPNIADFEAAVDRFVADYPRLVEAAARVRGDLFDAAQYPSLDAIKSKFGVFTRFSTFPEAGDFRLSLGASATTTVMNSMQADLEKRLTAVDDFVMNELNRAATRANTALSAESLRWQAVVSAMLSATEWARTSNISGSARINEYAQRLTDIGQGLLLQQLGSDRYYELKRDLVMVISKETPDAQQSA